jgi:hypothetical protein
MSMCPGVTMGDEIVSIVAAPNGGGTRASGMHAA